VGGASLGGAPDDRPPNVIRDTNGDGAYGDPLRPISPSLPPARAHTERWNGETYEIGF